MDHHPIATMPAGHAGMNEECDGSIDPSRRGSWKGHVFPGAIFIVWGAYWAYSVCAFHLAAAPRRPYAARAWYPFPVRRLRLLEPVLKVVGPLVAVSIELYFDHPAYRYLFCPPGTLHAGRFAMTHMNNWQHAASYPGFVLSGAVDLLSLWVPFPRGTGHATLGAAFAAMTFLMGTHEKHEPLDKMVHWLLFVSMLLCLVALLAELHAPRNPLAGLAKAAAATLQGAWLVQVGRIEFEDHPHWSADYGGGTVFAPVAFCMIGVLVVACLVALYGLMVALHRSGLLPLWLLPADIQRADAGDAEPLCLKGEFSNDSARDSDHSDGDSPHAGGHGRGAMTPFRVMDGAAYVSAKNLEV